MINYKYTIKVFLSLLLISILVGCLFVVFKESHSIILALKFLVFPGIIFVFFSIMFIDWYDRKLIALMQDRVGPPFLQPIYDTIKLLLKEDITPDGVDDFEFNIIPPLQFIITLLVAFTVPVYLVNGIISFEGDMLLIIFLVSLIGGTIFLLGWSTNNNYSIMGGSRAAITDLSFEIPLSLSFAGIAILSGSLRLSKLTESNYNLLSIPLGVLRGDFGIEKLIYLVPLIILFIIALLSITAVIEKVPFDPAHAEPEIVGGWSVELSGIKLLFVRFANLILEFALVGVIVAIFLGGPRYPSEIDLSGIFIIGNWDVLVYLLSITVFVIKMLLVLFLITFIRAMNSRIRIDQLVHYFWIYYLPIAIFGVFMILIFVTLGI